MSRRSWWVPEVVQTSGMDCGPAALGAVLSGFGIRASYGGLREAANTDVDGTSIDTIEDLAIALGVDASQAVVPAEHVLLPAARNLPCIAVVKLPSGVLHFVVLWRVVGPWVQVMDPGVGRRWMSHARVLGQLYRHEMALPRADWQAHAASPDFERPLIAEIRALGVTERDARQLVAEAGTREPLGPAGLEAAVRFVAEMRRAVRLPRGQVRELIQRLARASHLLPNSFFSVVPVPDDARPPEAGGEGADEPLVVLRGVVLLRMRGASPRPVPPALRKVARADVVTLAPLYALVRQDGLGRPALATLLAALSAGLSVLEALVFRSLVDLSGDFATARHRALGLATIAALVVVHAAIDRGFALALATIGRRVEVRLRAALYEKLARLDDVYFRTRLVSDLADRAHGLHRLAELPQLAGRLVRLGFEVVLVVAAIGVLDPLVLPIACLGAAAIVGLPLLVSPILTERDRAAREHWAALATWFLDALRAVWAVRAHVADGPIRAQHEGGVVAWVSGARRALTAQVGSEMVSMFAGIVVAVGVLAIHTAHAGWTGAALLLVWWSLLLPMLGERIGATYRILPEARNVALRMLEPLTGPEVQINPNPALSQDPSAGGVSVVLRGVTVRLGGQPVLDGVNLDIEAGSHVAVVGRSGSGKSTLVAALLGFYDLDGEIEVDGAPLDPPALRAVTRWIDPGVQLWNRSVVANLRYGGGDDDIGEVLAEADLLDLVGQLPDGLQTAIGEGGGRLSGGEGQRVRLGRGLARRNPRLVLLDEAFRGLDRHHRGRMLDVVRNRSEHATLVCVTHDIEHALTFDRVAVMEGGRLVEQGVPTELAARSETRFARLLAAEGRVLDRQRDAFGPAKVDAGRFDAPDPAA